MHVARCVLELLKKLYLYHSIHCIPPGTCREADNSVSHLGWVSGVGDDPSVAGQCDISNCCLHPWSILTVLWGVRLRARPTCRVCVCVPQSASPIHREVIPGHNLVLLLRSFARHHSQGLGLTVFVSSAGSIAYKLYIFLLIIYHYFTLTWMFVGIRILSHASTWLCFCNMFNYSTCAGISNHYSMIPDISLS